MRYIPGIIATVVVMGIAPAAFAQGTPAGEIAVGYQFVSDTDLDETLPAGWFLSGAGNIAYNFAIVGEVAGSHQSEGDPDFRPRLDLVTFLGGLRFRGGSSAVTPFAQFLAGGARLSVSVSGEGGSSTDFAIQPGGGVDIRITGNVAARAMVDYRRIFFEFGSVDEIRVAGGIVVGFGGR